MHDIDCHIIIHKEPQWKIDRCMASFDGQAVNVHLVQGEDEYPPFKSRVKGFALGSAPYVCYADPDDWVEPNAFEILNTNLGADFIRGTERVWKDGKVLSTSSATHHLFVVKRGFGFDSSCASRFPYTKFENKRLLADVLYNWDLTGGRYG